MELTGRKQRRSSECVLRNPRGNNLRNANTTVVVYAKILMTYELAVPVRL
jgi:hypothetical protein